MPDVSFGQERMTFRVPPSLEIEEPRTPVVPEEDVDKAVDRALRIPMGKPPLHVAAKGARNAVIVVPDASRPVPTARLLVPIVAGLEKAGVPLPSITVLVALGMHRRTTDDEKRTILGALAERGLRIVDHDPRGALTDLGEGAGGAPLLVSRVVTESDFPVSVGCLEPHQYAGFSGGWKTVGIGCAGEATIAFTHSPHLLSDRNCRPGNVDRNPFLDVVRDAGRKANLKFALNVVPSPTGGITAAVAGDPGVVFRMLVPRAQKAYALPFREPAGVVVAGLGSTKSASLYQASRAATNLVFGPDAAVKEGGTIIIPAPCPEGVGRGEGERAFGEALRGDREVLADREDGTFRPGEQRAWVVARAMRECRIVVAGSSLDAADLGAMGFGASPDVDTALREAAGAGAKRLMIVQRAVGCLPQRTRGLR